MTLTSAETRLAESDPIMADIIGVNGSIILEPRADYYASLSKSIISQQISVKAADKIYRRFTEQTKLRPVSALEIDRNQARLIGLSERKLQYIQDLAGHFVNDSAVFNHLDGLSDDDVIAELTKIKGIGVWTAQMFLIFTLHRPDVFAPDDRGLQIAIDKHYRTSTSRQAMMELAETWQPYRTTACLHLWVSLDNTP